MLKANKGEWSEFYVFLKILSEGRLGAADKNLNTLDGKYFIFHKIIREENPGERKIYDLQSSISTVQIIDATSGQTMLFSDPSFSQKIKRIFQSIKDSEVSTFEIKEAQSLMSALACTKIKASGAKKEDIVGVIDDRISPSPIELGFSIKSKIGGASTLLNAGDTTNFIFKVVGFNGDIDEINLTDGRSKIRDRIKKIYEKGGSLVFYRPKNAIFASNLRKIDTIFPKIISCMLISFYSGNATTVADLTKLLVSNRDLSEYGFSFEDFEYKIKNFLDSVALGMVPGKEWDGSAVAQGGYIIVKENGDVVCYHLYNRDEFRSYLFDSTKFETPSSTRHNFGSLYEENGELFFNLNLQIRF